MIASIPVRRHFASDNYAGICPEAFAAMAEANHGHETSYGDDTWTGKASNLIREIFEKDCEVFFVFNGTAANSLSLASLCQSYHSILCHELAHVEVAGRGAHARLARSHGRRAVRQRRRRARRRTEGNHVAGGRGCAVFWRHEERHR